MGAEAWPTVGTGVQLEVGLTAGPGVWADHTEQWGQLCSWEWYWPLGLWELGQRHGQWDWVCSWELYWPKDSGSWVKGMGR